MSQIDSALLADLLRQAMNEGKHPYLTVISNSMAPLIKRGDQIQIGPVTAETLQPGEIVVFLGPAQMITHRYWGYLAETNQTRLVTKGDRPQHFDEPFAPAKLVGRVLGRRREKKVLDFVNGSGGWLNNQLAKLARLEIRLFSKSPAHSTPAQAQLPPVSERFSNNSTGLFIRVFRRFSYSWAIILTLLVSGLSSVFYKNIED
jgi:signal peptidase I